MIAYSRVSTVDQGESGAGLAAQRVAILQAHPNITEWHQDVQSGSGKKALPGREAAIEACIRTKQPLVCAKLDRLTRSAIDFYNISELSRKHGFTLILLDISLDTSTPMGEAMAGMVAVFAQLERRRISERTSEGMQAKKAQGARFGKPPVPAHAVDRARELLKDVSPAEAYRVLKSENMPIGRTAVYALNR